MLGQTSAATPLRQGADNAGSPSAPPGAAPLPHEGEGERERVTGVATKLTGGAASDGWGGRGRWVAAAVAVTPRRAE